MCRCCLWPTLNPMKCSSGAEAPANVTRWSPVQASSLHRLQPCIVAGRRLIVDPRDHRPAQRATSCLAVACTLRRSDCSTRAASSGDRPARPYADGQYTLRVRASPRHFRRCQDIAIIPACASLLAGTQRHAIAVLSRKAVAVRSRWWRIASGAIPSARRADHPRTAGGFDPRQRRRTRQGLYAAGSSAGASRCSSQHRHRFLTFVKPKSTTSRQPGRRTTVVAMTQPWSVSSHDGPRSTSPARSGKRCWSSTATPTPAARSSVNCRSRRTDALRAWRRGRAPAPGISADDRHLYALAKAPTPW